MRRILAGNVAVGGPHRRNSSDFVGAGNRTACRRHECGRRSTTDYAAICRELHAL